jgi:hypothetical protein
MNVIEKRKDILKDIIENNKSTNQLININVNIAELQTIILGYIKLVIFEWRFSGFSFSLTERAQNFIKILECIIKK